MMLCDALKIVAGVQDCMPYAKQFGIKPRDKMQESPWAYKERVERAVKIEACKIITLRITRCS